MANPTSFHNAQVTFGVKPVKVTPGLGVRGEVSSSHLHMAFGLDQPHNINMGYARVFSATTRYYGKPMVGIN
jgi:hypothetical protein